MAGDGSRACAERRLRVVLLSALVALGLMLGHAAPASAFSRGFADSIWFTGSPAADASWVAKTEATGARYVSIEVDWTSVEPDKPASVDSATSPDGPQYDFGYLDQWVEEFAGTGLTPIFLVTDAPRWAQGSGGTKAEYADGAYKPDAKALGQLAEALAKRYSGSYPNPLDPGSDLPRVSYFQAWAEASLDLHLAPQWTRAHGRWVNTGATLYRAMLNSFYAGVNAGDSDDVVLSTGLPPYGDPPGGDRTHPVTFLENVLCLNTELHKRCGDTAHFDILASDPYDVFAPTVHALSPLDASAPDLGRLTRVANAGVAAGTLLPRKHKSLWVTEFEYESDPPNRAPGVATPAQQAHLLEESFYVFWKQGASTVLWYLVADQPPPYSINYGSGVYFRDGKPKPSLTAYRFPLVVMRDGRRAQIWGIAPVSGTVRVQRRFGGRWRTVATFTRSAGAVFDRTIAADLTGDYRATVANQTSRAWNY